MTISSIEKEFEEKYGKSFEIKSEPHNYIHRGVDPSFRLSDVKSFYRQKIEAFGKEVREQENQAWIDGKRCHYCGRAKPYDALCDTCDDCLDN